MCESTVYLQEKDGELKKVMDNVIFVTPQKDSVFIEDILGEQMNVKGTLREIKLLDHKVLIDA